MTGNRIQTKAAIERVRERVHSCEAEFGRPHGCVRLVAVSKTKPADQIAQAIAAGQCDFGENYLGEAAEKMTQLNAHNCHWHFIGPIQSNKTRQVAAHFSWVHCIDREKIAQRLSSQRPVQLPALNICIQVNIDKENSKSGVPAEGVAALANSIARLDNIRLRGLMAIPSPAPDFDAQRRPFARLRTLFERLQSTHPSLDTLSMGMSVDLRAAIAEGATMVRIGTAIFGARPAK